VVRLDNAYRRSLDAFSWGRPRPKVGMAQRKDLPSVLGVVFSRDRPMQLDALLRSYFAMVSDPAPLDVLFRASNTQYALAYEQLANSFDESDVRFIDECANGGFESSLRELVAHMTAKTMFFLVDDILFIRAFELHQFAALSSPDVIPSMRLGRNISYSYTRRSQQRQPRLLPLDSWTSPPTLNTLPLKNQLVCWRWRRGQIDWRYPFSVDGNILPTTLVRALLDDAVFSGPNSLEVEMDRLGARNMPRWGICFTQSRIINSPINRVQNEVSNFSGKVHQDLLLNLWIKGNRMDISRLGEVTCRSVHEEIDLPFVKELS
jgi:hypothetical protein